MQGPRRAAYEASRRRLGVTVERAYLQHTPQGDLNVVSLEADDVAGAFHGLATSQDRCLLKKAPVRCEDAASPADPPREGTAGDDELQGAGVRSVARRDARSADASGPQVKFREPLIP